MRVETNASLSLALEPAIPVRLQTEPSVKVQETKRPSEANDSRKKGDGAQAAQAKIVRTEAPDIASSNGRLTIDFDKSAGMFVQRLIDPKTDEVLRQYPHDSHLMMARAQKAYEAAILQYGKPNGRSR
jgi:uncharacterized FlaG/YvyC family protein